MAEKLHVRLKKGILNRLRAHALLVGEPLESVVTTAIMEWVNNDSWKPATEKRIDAILPVTKDGIGYLKDRSFERQMTLTRAAEEAVEDYLAKYFQEPVGTVEAEKPTFDPPAESEPEPSRECHCTACGHAWTPKGKGQPAYCPKCRSKEWDKVVMCENSCDRPIAPLNTEAGSSNMCAPCYAEMKASWGGEPSE